MAYQTYITEALVCGSRDNNTSDRSYLLFTREGGMVWASARSVREERSKQRFALQDFSRIRVTLVRGKFGWRVAGVEALSNLYYGAEDRKERTLFRNVLRLLRRVVQGEVPHAGLYDDVLANLEEYRTTNPRDLELIVTLRVLYALGYIASEGAVGALLEERFQPRGLTEVERTACGRMIDHGLLQSQL